MIFSYVFDNFFTLIEIYFKQLPIWTFTGASKQTNASIFYFEPLGAHIEGMYEHGLFANNRHLNKKTFALFKSKGFLKKKIYNLKVFTSSIVSFNAFATPSP
jgi:hypothetical protein